MAEPERTVWDATDEPGAQAMLRRSTPVEAVLAAADWSPLGVLASRLAPSFHAADGTDRHVAVWRAPGHAMVALPRVEEGVDTLDLLSLLTDGAIVCTSWSSRPGHAAARACLPSPAALRALHQPGHGLLGHTAPAGSVADALAEHAARVEQASSASRRAKPVDLVLTAHLVRRRSELVRAELDRQWVAWSFAVFWPACAFALACGAYAATRDPLPLASVHALRSHFGIGPTARVASLCAGAGLAGFSLGALAVLRSSMLTGSGAAVGISVGIVLAMTMGPPDAAALGPLTLLALASAPVGFLWTWLGAPTLGWLFSPEVGAFNNPRQPWIAPDGVPVQALNGPRELTATVEDTPPVSRAQAALRAAHFHPVGGRKIAVGPHQATAVVPVWASADGRTVAEVCDQQGAPVGLTLRSVGPEHTVLETRSLPDPGPVELHLERLLLDPGLATPLVTRRALDLAWLWPTPAVLRVTGRPRAGLQVDHVEGIEGALAAHARRTAEAPPSGSPRGLSLAVDLARRVARCRPEPLSNGAVVEVAACAALVSASLGMHAAARTWGLEASSAPLWMAALGMASVPGLWVRPPGWTSGETEAGTPRVWTSVPVPGYRPLWWLAAYAMGNMGALPWGSQAAIGLGTLLLARCVAGAQIDRRG